jgi:SAM-dependent methyltransferase
MFPPMQFRDLFSGHAGDYARFRPSYPAALFDWAAGLVNEHSLAWDCATGNGQAAVPLAVRFDRVIATDASEQQISEAKAAPRVEYRLASAYDSGLETGSASLVTVAQALHWFDLDLFYKEVRRVLIPNGAIAVWGYGDPVLETPELDRILHDYNRGTIENYWQPERDILLAGYRTIQFPFREVAVPEFMMECEWTLPELAGYLRTWSATVRYASVIGRDPVAVVERALAAEWGDSKRRAVRWPLVVRAGRKTSPPKG